MRVVEVSSQEEGRIDLLLIRTLGKDTPVARSYFHYVNPDVDFTELKAGTLVNIPDEITFNKIKCIRCYFLNSYLGE